jgi:hypothetical protein
VGLAGGQWLTPVILATQEAVIRRIVVQSQPRQIVCETLSQKKNPSQNRAGGVTQGASPEFNIQHLKKKSKNLEGAGGVTQLVEHLYSKCETLSSILQYHQKNKLE